MLKVGERRSFGVTSTQMLEVIAILLVGGVGGNKLRSFKRGVQNVLPCFAGGDAKSFGSTTFPFCIPPSSTYDQSLREGVVSQISDRL